MALTLEAQEAYNEGYSGIQATLIRDDDGNVKTLREFLEATDFGGSVPVSRVVSITDYTATGSTVAGAKSLAFKVLSGSVVIAGATFDAGDTLTVDTQGRDTLDVVSFTITTGNLRVVRLD